MQVATFQERPWSHRPPALEWWAELNAELSDLGESEACLGDVDHFYRSGYSPTVAASRIAKERRESRR